MCVRHLLLAATLLVPIAARAAGTDIDANYSTPGDKGRVSSTVILCPSADGTVSAVACNFGSGTTSPGTASTVTRSTPLQPNAVPIGTSPTLTIPASQTYQSIRYYVQGANGVVGCATWGSTAPAFATNGCAVGFPIFNGSVETRLSSRDGVMPTTPLMAIANGVLSITYEVQ